MDHLPLPPNACQIDLRVPDLCGLEPYDGGPFRTFPMRYGWIHPDHPATSNGFFVEYEMSYRSQDPELEKLLQSWLFFGLLHQVLGDEFYRAADYRGRDEKGPYIHTRKLTATLAKWTSDKDDWTQEQKRDLFQVLARHCSLAIYSLGVLAPHFHHGDFNKTIRQSLAAVGELLTSALDQLIGSVESPASWRSLYWREDTKRDMLHNGWCENQIAAALGQFKSLSAAHYLRHMTALSQPGVHGNCTENECRVLSVVPSDYEPEHVGQCQCDLVGPRPEDVYDALLSQRIPFIRIRGSTLDDVSLEVVKKQISERPAYVALSHVWAHGLGQKPGRMELPKCQMLRLSRILGALRNCRQWEGVKYPEGEVLFWCDPLCVPPTLPNGSPRHDQAKGIALEGMRSIYSNATFVLTLDQSLVDCYYDEHDPFIPAFRLFTSDWTRRLWTFQEAVLPKNLLIQYRNEAVDLRRLWLAVRQASERAKFSHRSLSIDVQFQCRSIRRHFHMDSPTGSPPLVSIATGTEHRRASRSTDEALCLATLMDVASIRQIFMTPAQDRMYTFWSLMSNVSGGTPGPIIFTPYPRLRRRGFRWAPSTLARSFGDDTGFYINPELHKSGVLGENGLLVKCSAFQLGSGARTGVKLSHATIELLDVCADVIRFEHPAHSGQWYRLTRTNNDKMLDRRTPGQMLAEDTDPVLLLESSDWDPSTYNEIQRGLLTNRERLNDGSTVVVSRAIVLVQKSNMRDTVACQIASEQARVLKGHEDFQKLLPTLTEADTSAMDRQAAVTSLQNLALDIIRRELSTSTLAGGGILHVAGFPEYCRYTMLGELCGEFAEVEAFYPSTTEWCVD